MEIGHGDGKERSFADTECAHIHAEYGEHTQV